jgi:hypothetical protein
MKKYCTFLLPVLLIFSSCIGISADIQMNRDGSGRMILEYRFSRISESVGRLDGNERWNIIPTGRADLQRTVDRIEGLRLTSFSSREDEYDTVNRATLDFNDTDALLKFLDPQGRRAKFTRENNANKLQLILNEPISSQIDGDLLALMKQVSMGYKASVSFSAPGSAQLTLTDGAGNPLPPPSGAQVVPSGRKVSVTLDTAEILNLSGGLGVIFTW